MTELRLDDPGGKQWILPQVQLSDDSITANTDVFTAPGFGSDQTFISVLGEQETFDLTGLVTAPALSGRSSPNSYNSDWRTALAEWVQRGEAFAHASQDTGYTLVENDRGRTSLNVVIEDFTWTYEQGAIYQVSYELTLRRGDGLLPDASISVGGATPGGTSSVPSVGGTDLKGFDSLEVAKSMGDLQVVERAFADNAGANDIIAGQGTTLTVTYRGQYPGSASTRNSFDDTIRGYIDDTTRTLATVFPGYSISVKVTDFESTRDWSHGSNMHEYVVTMQEAQ